ncbi:hypothetical protein K435DRAFT_665894 [Dendrothele bispora CBS 962.96]|uniref:DNA breaking-rejoining enzyme n=1 Tax=Dendrothele bispora (strain CBS 962.96) TaxID=1314807 RepID=A0A4S8M0W4_DENBC|nr:hypothetical protein K435DRAFT_665894 [Dendrothele bispora CBS 962.96]
MAKGSRSQQPASKAAKKTTKKRTSSGEEPVKKRPKVFKDLIDEAETERRKHSNAGNTNSGYASVRSRTKAWAKEFASKTATEEKEKLFEESQEIVDIMAEPEDEDASIAEANKYEKIPDDFATALDGAPTSTTPLVIRLYMYVKCFEEGLGDSTAWSIFSAWKKYYDDLGGEGEYRDRKFEFDRETKKFVGNPTETPLVKDMLDACKNKDGESDRKHSRPMSFDDMSTLFKWSWSICPDDAPIQTADELKVKTRHLSFRAYISTAFVLWTRSCETSKLKGKDIDWVAPPRPNAPPGDPPAIEIRLTNRKGWQRKKRKGGDQRSGHSYLIPAQPMTPAIDAKARLEAHKSHIETHVLKRALEPEEYIFPSMSANGLSAHFNTHMDPEKMQKVVKEFAKCAGLPGWDGYTTHCFRRGGAQYRFMYAPNGERWTLAKIRWWGGWALNERRDTLIRYLLDELRTYEEDHSDSLFPINLAKDQSFMGEAAEQAPLKTSEARILIANLENRMQTHVEKSIAAVVKQVQVPAYWPPFWQETPYHPQTSQDYYSHTPPAYSLPSNSHVPLATVTSSQPRATFYYPSGPIPIAPFNLKLPSLKGAPLSEAFKVVVQDWEYADVKRGHEYALKDWKEEWTKDKSVASAYCQRKKVALEFIETYKRDESKFREAYPEYAGGFKKLHDAILNRQKEAGIVRTRNSRYSKDN